ncbi:MAG: hypothetical protein NUW01_05165, partial [Gemmatimonadaceae bacterium]|nr:hypothetical protein [Gemmatimonadaceae bacterium]
IARLNAHCTLELEVTQKDTFRGPLGMFPPGFGAMAHGSDVGSGRNYGQQGTPSRDAVDMAPVPVHIHGTEKYAVILHNDSGRTIEYYDDEGGALNSDVLRLRIHLVCLHKRAAG